MSIREHLQDLYDKNHQLTPELVVKTAKPKTHPLHAHFEWDDAAAGDAWRRHQAAEMIRSVRIVYQEDDDTMKSVRAYHAVRTPSGDSVYSRAEDIAGDPLVRAMVLRDMEREWKAMKRRYGNFQEFLDLITAEVEAA